MDVTIRRGVPSDAGAIARVYLRARKAAARAGSIPPPVHTDDEVARWIAGVVVPRLPVWVAERPREGVVAMLVLDGQWVEQLYVDPMCTGRGIGSRLLDVARRESPDGLRLWTFASNEGAQRFYERHGFVPIERTDGSGNEEGAPDILYAIGDASARPSTDTDGQVRLSESGE